jgi:hypothetical protein
MVRSQTGNGANFNPYGGAIKASVAGARQEKKHTNTGKKLRKTYKLRTIFVFKP